MPCPAERAVRQRAAAVRTEDGQRQEVPGPDAAGQRRRDGGGARGLQSAERQIARELGQPLRPDKDDVRTGSRGRGRVRGQAEEERREDVERHMQMSVGRQHRLPVDENHLVQTRVVGRERVLARHQVRVQTGRSETPRAVVATDYARSPETGPLTAVQQLGDHGAPAVYLLVAGQIRGPQQ